MPSIPGLAKSIDKIKKAWMFLWSHSLVYFLIATFTAQFLIDQPVAQIRRVDHFRENTLYLFSFLSQKESYDKTRLEKALRYYQRLAKVLPGWRKYYAGDLIHQLQEAYEMTGLCHYYLKDYAKAADCFEKLRQKNAQYFAYDHNLGIIYCAMGDYTKALEHLRMAAPKNGAQIELYKNVASLQKNDARASEFFWSMASLAARSYFDNLILSIACLYRTRSYDQLFASLAGLEGELAFKPSDIAYYYAGRSSYDLAEYARALRYLKKGLAINKDNPNILFYLGLVYQRLGRKVLAEQNFTLAENLRREHGYSQLPQDKLTVELFFDPSVYNLPEDWSIIVPQAYAR